MKYCPQCNKQYSEAWLTFCTDDGSLLREDLTPPADPNYDPRIRETKYDNPSEQSTQWLPRDPPVGGAWLPPDERAPLQRAPARGASDYARMERPWQPPPPPPMPHTSQTPPGIAIASLIVGIIGIAVGLMCAIPIPGIIALILGIIALKQMSGVPGSPGRGFAIAGIVMGSVNLVIFALMMLWIALSVAFG